MKKNILIHAAVVLFCFLISAVYMAPALSGKLIRQGDMEKVEAMAHQQLLEHDQSGQIPNWNGSMFSGMPGYHTASSQQQSAFTPIKYLLTLRFFRGDDIGFSREIGVLFLYLIGFYVALLAFGCSWWLALLGALAFGLGSYNIIVIEAGHIAKAWAMGMIAPILAGMALCLRRPDDNVQGVRRWRNRMLGGILFAVALGLQLTFNHIQITYYTALGGFLLGLVYLVQAWRKHALKYFFGSVGILVLGALLALACNSRLLMVNQEYVQQTMRGGSEITVKPTDANGNILSTHNDNESGLDINYAFSWSYGVGETYTLLVPGAMGGGSNEHVERESASYQNFRIEEAPLYWGDQPFTSGPVYFGAAVMLLALLGLLVAKGRDRWWILMATLLAILLSWGNNFMPFNRWIFDHLPLYNKFRTPSMSLVLANVCLVIVAVLGLQSLINAKQGKVDTQLRRKQNRALYIATGVTGGILLLGLLLCSGFSFSGGADTQMAHQYGAQWTSIQEIFIRDRKALFVHDTWRSLLFVLLSAATVWLYINDKLKKAGWLVGVLSLLVVIDLWGVDRRYLNEKNFHPKRQLELRPDAWDATIDQMAIQDGVKEYRVLNLAVNTFNDSKPSAFHNQIGGYSAVKLRRYQDIIDFYLNGRINPNVLNMLNTRYVVVGNGQVQTNPAALGNCWWVDSLHVVADANAEILALGDSSWQPGRLAFIDGSQFSVTDTRYTADSSDRIELELPEKPNSDLRRYRTHSAHERLAVFSEVYYAPDWRAYIDDQPAEYMRADYILRAIVVPAGDHVVEFRNEAPTFHRWDRITLACSIVFVLLIVATVTCYLWKRRKEQ